VTRAGDQVARVKHLIIIGRGAEQRAARHSPVPKIGP